MELEYYRQMRVWGLPLDDGGERKLPLTFGLFDEWGYVSYHTTSLLFPLYLLELPTPPPYIARLPAFFLFPPLHHRMTSSLLPFHVFFNDLKYWEGKVAIL